jgi:tyrosine-protein phosphatase SIW14
MKTVRFVRVRRFLSSLFVLPLLAAAALAGQPGAIAAPTTANSMGPLQVPGIEIDNFGVVDGRIYRGEQPKGDEYAALAALGVKTVIDLREDAKSSSRASAEQAGLRYVHIPIDGHGMPTDADARVFVEAATNAANGPVFVHCAGGRHRTGSMIAVYRMVVNGWTLEKAYDEMLAYDFYTSNGHKGFKTYVEDYFERMTANPASVPVAFRAAAATEAR